MSFLEQFFKKFELKMHIAVVQRLQGDPKGPKEGAKHSFRTTKDYLNPNSLELSTKHCLQFALLLRMSSDFFIPVF